MPQIVVVGEGMVELSAAPGGAWRVGHGGDALNTALHLCRLGADVGFLSALGTDPFSAQLRHDWVAEGLDPALLLVDEQRRPGLYAISNDPDGERHFTYWRGESAARRLFDLPGIDAALAQAERADLLLFSMISLAVLPADGRDALLDLAARVRRSGGQVAFDTNYRPALWRDRSEAQDVHRAAMAHADIGLPTVEDEVALTGAGDAAGILDHWRAAGVGEVVLKQGAAGCVVDGVTVAPPLRLDAVDTSGAGDAFNAGYLHARLRGQPPRAAALAGHCLAGWTVMQRGAIPDAAAGAPYDDLRAG